MSLKSKPRAVSLLKGQEDTIRTSSDYDRFVPHGQQRIIKSGQVKKLMASMKTYGFMPSHPIAAFRDNDKFRIIDGHHRHAAAKSLGIPIRFVLLAKEYETAVGDTNIGKPWTCIEWARKYTLEGRPHYLTLNKYVVRGIPVLQAAALLYGISAGSGNVNRLLVSGEFVVRDTQQIDTICAFKDEFGSICPAVNTRNFIAAFSLCYQVPQFDIKQLRARLLNNPKMLTKTANSQQMLELLEEIYNFQSRTRIPLAFLAKEAASNRAAVKKPNLQAVA